MENAEERQHIGEIIRNARKGMKMTQKELSNILAVRQDVISDYENGNTKVIPFEKRVKIASSLGLPVESLLYDDEVIPSLRQIKKNTPYIAEDIETLTGSITKARYIIHSHNLEVYGRYFLSLNFDNYIEATYVITETFARINDKLLENGELFISDVIGFVILEMVKKYGASNDIIIWLQPAILGQQILEEYKNASLSNSKSAYIMQTLIKSSLYDLDNYINNAVKFFQALNEAGDAGLPPMPANEKEK